ncbi:MAG: type I restriction endonuclease subunit R, partial [Bacteroidales bacterium]|nr:type I restriction endonuclease subunit R [Bacteroidales bacterium]
ILDFRSQQDAVDTAIALFSGEKEEKARQIWLVEPASVILKKYNDAVAGLRDFMAVNDLDFKAEEVPNLKGDAAKADFINRFKEVQRLKTQLDQYTDLVDIEAGQNQSSVAEPPVQYGFTDDDLRAFRGAYLDLARNLKGKREKSGEKIPDEIEDLDFEFVLFASAMIDYDYIMELISRCMGHPAKWKMTKDELINLIRSSANLLDDRDDIIAYIDSLDGVNGRTEQQIKDGYEVFKAEKYAKELSAVARKHNLETDAVMLFVNDIVERRIFDGEKLNELLEPLDLGWRDRTRKETELMNDLVPLLKRLVPGQEISGLKAYEE